MEEGKEGRERPSITIYSIQEGSWSQTRMGFLLVQLQLTDKDLHGVLFIIHLARRLVGAQTDIWLLPNPRWAWSVWHMYAYL